MKQPTEQEPVVDTVHTQEAEPTDLDTLLDRDAGFTKRLEQSVLSTLQTHTDGLAIIERRDQLLKAAYMAALKRTRPEDWLLTKDKQGHERAMLSASGAQIVAQLYGVQPERIWPIDKDGGLAPKREDLGEGIYSLTLWGDFHNALTGYYLPALEFTRRSDEDFTGRTVTTGGALTKERTGIAAPSDLRKSVYTGLLTSAVRATCGLTRVSVRDLADAWSGTNKAVDMIPKGHGYGTGEQRQAAAAATPESTAATKSLEMAMLGYCGGDAKEALELMQKLSGFKNDKGETVTAKSWEQLAARPKWMANVTKAFDAQVAKEEGR